jgi:hypothetical protein
MEVNDVDERVGPITLPRGITMLINRRAVSLMFLALVLPFFASSVLASQATPKARLLSQSDSSRVLVEGTVVSADGKRLPKIVGVCRNQNTGTFGPIWVSAKDGKFAVTLEPGIYRIWARGAMARAVEFVARASGGKAHVKVVGDPRRNGLLLKFESPEGKAIPNTTISYGMAGGRAYVETDANGFHAYTPTAVPLHLFFVLRGVGYADLNITSEEVFFGDEPVVARLNSGVFVSGRITSKQGVALGGISVFPQREYTPRDKWSWWGTQFGFKSFSYTMKEPSMAISSDGDGEFRLGPLPAGNYSLIMGLPGIWHVFPSTDLIKPHSMAVDLTSGKDLSDLDLSVPEIKPAYDIQGRALKSDKTPLASQEITVEVSGDYKPGEEPEEWYVWEPVVRRVVTDAQGGFKLYPIRPGKYKLVAKWHGLSATVRKTVQSDMRGLDFVLR